VQVNNNTNSHILRYPFGYHSQIRAIMDLSNQLALDTLDNHTI